jgi:hypothetical protein
MILSAPLRAASASDIRHGGHRLHRTNAHTGGADRPRSLLHLILRRVRQQPFVVGR